MYFCPDSVFEKGRRKTGPDSMISVRVASCLAKGRDGRVRHGSRWIDPFHLLVARSRRQGHHGARPPLPSHGHEHETIHTIRDVMMPTPRLGEQSEFQLVSSGSFPGRWSRIRSASTSDVRSTCRRCTSPYSTVRSRTPMRSDRKNVDLCERARVASFRSTCIGTIITSITDQRSNDQC